jgi:CDP-diacylglycerol---glycerol-3-phosphate 3-phosphatidyltransferase
MILTLPNLLTMSRIAAIPVLVGLFYLESDLGAWIACAVFSVAAVTDFFDGYIARATKQQSAFGKFLDPVADKLIVAASLLMLAAFGGITGLVLLPAVVILCREILVSGLREYLAEVKVGVPVSQLAKWKTTIQMFAIAFLIVGDAGPAALPVREAGEWALWVAAVLTLITGFDYMRAGLRHIQVSESTGDSARDGPGRR